MGGSKLAVMMCGAMTWKLLRDQVRMVLQNNVLFSGTITDNLRWGNANATGRGKSFTQQKIAQADSFYPKEFPNKYDTMISEGGNIMFLVDKSNV